MVEADKALVERLKLHKSWRDSQGELNDAPNLAAARIEAMADEIEALRKGLAQIRDMDPVELALDPEWAQRQARALLKGTPDNGQG